MNFSDLGTEAVRLVAAMWLLGGSSKVVIAWLALRGTKPGERDKILKTLPAVFHSLQVRMPGQGRDRQPPTGCQ